MKQLIKLIIGKNLYVKLSQLKTYIVFSKKLKILKKNKNKKKCILIDTPLYGNMGDQAITIAEQEWINNDFIDYFKFFFTVNEMKLMDYGAIKKLKKYINEEDIIFLQGGGHFGDLYIDSEILKRHVVKTYSDNKIIIFPSTMNFSDTVDGMKQKDISKEIYDKHKDLTIILREEKSFKDANNTFENVKLKLTPDVVFYLCGTDIQKYINENSKKDDILICFRKDKETYHGLDKKNELVKKLKDKYVNIKEQDTMIAGGVKEKKRMEKVIEIIRTFSNSKLVVTDRYHGMIFSILTKTPCIVLRSSDHKIVESIKWIQEFKVIEYVNDLELVEDKIDELIEREIEENVYENLYSNIKKNFFVLKNV